eukprot:gene5305-7077_t
MFCHQEFHLNVDRTGTVCSEFVNGGNSNGHLIGGRTEQSNIRRGLMFFNVQSYYQSSVTSQIQSATLVLERARAASMSLGTTFSIWRITTPWTSGNSTSESGLCASATPGDATWAFSSFNKTRWNTPGVDFSPSKTSHATSTQNNTFLFDVTEDVNQWMQGQIPNHGWLLRGNESKDGTASLFYGRKSYSPPYLIVIV